MSDTGIETARGFIARIVFGAANSRLSVVNTGLVLAGGTAKRVIPLSSLTKPIRITTGRVWARLEIGTTDGILSLGGYRPGELQSLSDLVNSRLRSHTCHRLATEQKCVKDAAQRIRQLLSQQQYASASKVAPVLEDARAATARTHGLLWDLYATQEQKQDSAVVKKFLEHWEDQVAEANRTYVQDRLAAYSELFDTVEKSPLTRAQRVACVTEEDSNLVLAGAGTGKTSTMVGRVGYLLASGAADPSEILMLAFAKKAADELQERETERLAAHSPGAVPTVKTFHALGLEIIGTAEGRRPALSRLAEDSKALEAFIDQELERQCINPDYVADVLSWCFNHRFTYSNQFDFATENDYLEYVRTNELRTLNGELVKSYEELIIANFLCTNGVEYRYEEKYVIPEAFRDAPDHDTDTGYIWDAQHRPYMPDFFLPEHDIYIEHFALNGELRPPDGWKGYAEGVEWKRQTHSAYGTRLFETRSHMQHDGVLELSLAAMLRSAGVKLDPRPMDELLEELREQGNLMYVTEPIASFLQLFKQSEHDLQAVREMGAHRPNADRYDLFFMLFEPIYDAYERYLNECHEIDFSDMIKRAIGHVESGEYVSPYEHVLVDEFQDISPLRARLIRGLVKQRDSAVLFAVGDDWQAIYRFTGSDLGLMRQFENTFGPTATTTLDTTFRFNDRIGSVASSFVLKNPMQIAKDIKSVATSQEASISLLPTSDPEIGLNLAIEAIDERRRGTGAPTASVLVLGRYNYTTEAWQGTGAGRELKQKYPRVNIGFMTVHGAKGREADYVVVLGVETGRNGFPAEKPSEPLMELVLPTLENFKFAEERRLFYVAMTRARHRVYLIYEPSLASVFVQELAGRDAAGRPTYDVCSDEFLGANGAMPHTAFVDCPSCGIGMLGRKHGEYGAFIGCSRFPYCRYTEPPCPQCGSLMRRNDGLRTCTNPDCDEQSPVCSKCGAGMVRRTSDRGPFWGCLNYRSNSGNFCSHTINIGSPYRKSKKYGYGRR